MVANWLMEVIHNIILLHAATLLLCVFLNALWYTRTERNDTFAAYLCLQACLALWLLGKLVKTVAPVLWLRWAGVVAQYLGTCFLGPALFAFAYRYCLGRLPPRALLSVLGAAAAGLFCLAATNGCHHLLYGTFTMFRDSFGPVHTAITVLTFGLAAASCVLLGATFRRGGSAGAGARLLFIAAIVAPAAAYFYYPGITARYDGWKFDITPVFFGISFLLLGGALFRFSLLNVVRCAFNQVMEGLPDGIILTDRAGRIRYANPRAARSLPVLAPRLDRIGAEETPLPPHGAGLTHGYARPVPRGGGRRAGTVYRLMDLSGYVERRERYALKCAELERASEDLSRRILDRRAQLVARHGNRLASELHDVVGHSLTLAVALLDAAGNASGGPREAHALLDRAARALRDGADELDRALRDTEGEGAQHRLLSSALLTLPEFGRSPVKLDLQVIGREEPVPARKAEQLVRICEECLSNSIRHGRASHVSVVLGFRGRRVEVDIRDNGNGCRDIRRGNGLRDIAERVRDLDGSVRFSSGPDQGFHTRLWFPAA
jgi:signal transduction histidine kinase